MAKTLGAGMGVTAAGMPAYSEAPVELWQQGAARWSRDQVAEEVPISLIYNQMPYVVMLATPDQLEVFALGFSLSEGIIGSAAELKSLRIEIVDDGIEVHLRIPGERLRGLLNRRRNLAGRSGCGLCGVSELDQALRPVCRVGAGIHFEQSRIPAWTGQLRSRQSLNQLTGSVHAAAWVEPSEGIRFLCEDVGRHNALDKLIGTLAGQGVDVNTGLVLVTSRASYEMVQKSVAVGISCLVALSAPTALAVRRAQAAGLTLVGFARGQRHLVYSHPQRLIPEAAFSAV